MSVYANTHGTGKVADNALEAALVACMPLTPRNIRDQLGLNRAIYAPSAAYGHFGRTAGEAGPGTFSWEQQTSRIVSQLPSDVTAAACWRWRTVTKIADGVRHMMPERPQFYGRRKGRRLRPTMQGLMAEQLPGLRYDPARPVTAQFEGPVEDTFLEIGFGGGENLAAMAAARPEAGFIGAEPFVNGVASLSVTYRLQD